MGLSPRQFCSSQHKEVQEPNLVNLAEIDFHRVGFDETQYSLLAEAVNAMAIVVMPPRTFQPIAYPALQNLLLNFVVVLAEAKLKVADCVTLTDSA